MNAADETSGADGGAATRRGTRSRTTALLALGTLLALATIFLVLHFQLARNARYVPDDLCLAHSVRFYGPQVAQLVLYRNWSGRWASNAMVAYAMRVLPVDPRSSFPFAMALIVFASTMAWLIARLLPAAPPVRGVALPLFAVTTVALVFFASPHRGDSWFFVFCALENVVPIAAALLALACVLRSRERWWPVVPASMLAAVATACHESIALAVLACGATLLAMAAWRDRNDRRMRLGALVLGIAVASFLVSSTSPGSAARLAQLPRQPLLGAVWQTITEGPLVMLGIARTSAAVLAVSFLAWAVATCVLAPLARKRSSDVLRWSAPMVRDGATPGEIALAVVVLLPVAAIASTFPGYLALGMPPPERAQLVLAVALVVASAVLGALAGAALRARRHAAPVLTACLAAAVVVLLSREVVRMRADITTARAYAAAYDARTEYLLARRKERGREPIVVPALPPSGVLRDAELSSEQQGAYANRCLRRMLRLNRPVIRAPDPPAAGS